MMTLERAVEILNGRRHRGYDQWYARLGHAAGRDAYDNLRRFEAIAVAEKYERELPHGAGRRISLTEDTPGNDPEAGDEGTEERP